MEVFSQSSQAIPTNGPTSLSLYKLSFCTTAVPGAKMLWTHLTGRANMYAVFDRLRSIGLGGSLAESRILKLTSEADLLERIELDNLLFQVRLDEERIKSQALQDAERYVILIVKRPMIAIRYRLPDGKIRKLQLNFLPESGFDVAVKIFASLGLPIREKASLPPPGMTSFTTLYSQPQCPVPSPSHSQDSQVMHQPRPTRPTATRGILSSTNLDSPYQTALWDSYDARPPNSAPETYSDRSEVPAISFSQMLPPKRTLPFPKKNTEVTPSDLDIATATPSQASPTDSTTIGTPARKKKSRAAAPRVKKAAAPKRVRGRKTTEPKTMTQAPRLDGTSINPETICVPATPEAAPSSRKIVSPISLSSPRGPADDHSATTSTEPAKPAEPLQTAASYHQPFADSVEPTEFMSRLDGWVREYHQSLPAPKPPAPGQPAEPASSLALATASETLGPYAEQSKEERMAAVDELIRECLEDPSFVKLVEDVEDSWKRIGLGF